MKVSIEITDTATNVLNTQLMKVSIEITDTATNVLNTQLDEGID